MVDALPVGALAHNIQLAVAPVFLLAGIGSILNVLTQRLGRVIDRARLLEAEAIGYDPDKRVRAHRELLILGRRMASAHWAIGLCTASALLVCLVVALLFVGDLLPMNGPRVIGTLFVAAMAMLISGLILFLVEVQIAMRSVRVQAGELL
jgi:hypothetical protein